MSDLLNALGVVAGIAVLAIFWHVMNRCRNDRGQNE